MKTLLIVLIQGWLTVGVLLTLSPLLVLASTIAILYQITG